MADMWHIRTAASRIGVTPAQYLARRRAGEKWCTSCRRWQKRSEFRKDKHRGDGLASSCAASRSTGRPRGWHEKPAINPLTGRPGPEPNPPRDGDKIQARQRVNVEVRTGRREHPNNLRCVDCGHKWEPGERRHQYHHHLGFAPENHLKVIPVCTKCAARRSFPPKSHCKHGHRFTPANTYIRKNGCRSCRACMRAHEERRPPRGSEYWRRVNMKRARH